MSCFFEEIYLEEQEFLDQFDSIMDSITDETQKVWVIGHKVALIPVKLFELLNSAERDGEIESIA